MARLDLRKILKSNILAEHFMLHLALTFADRIYKFRTTAGRRPFFYGLSRNLTDHEKFLQRSYDSILRLEYLASVTWGGCRNISYATIIEKEIAG